jgi:2-oxoglutarate dehydrogenase complex dehydrogenase (E1) component-like enzyme
MIAEELINKRLVFFKELAILNKKISSMDKEISSMKKKFAQKYESFVLCLIKALEENQGDKESIELLKNFLEIIEEEDWLAECERVTFGGSK